MKKIITFGMLLLTFINSICVFSIHVEETTIPLKPGLNSVSTPGLLKGISFSNGGDNISFATLINQKRNAINITNDNVGEKFSPLTGFIVRNDSSEDVTMTLSYNTEDDSSNTNFEKILNKGRNLLGITNTSNPFSNIEDENNTNIIDFTNGEDTNKIIEGNTFPKASIIKLGKSYGVFIDPTNEGILVYSGENNNAKLDGFTDSECQEICEEDEDMCPIECRSGIISDNTISETSIKVNGTPKTIYNGTFSANKRLKLTRFFIFGDQIPEGDKINFYVNINGSEKTPITIDGENSNQQVTRSQIKINTGDIIQLKINAEYIGTSESTNQSYHYEFKLLGNESLFYETNFQGISLNIGGVDSGNSSSPSITISNEFLKAINRANSNGIINNEIVNYENINEAISNIDTLTIINKYAENILNSKIDNDKDCSFIDNIEFSSESLKAEDIKSCKLGLIKDEDNINLSNQTDLSILSTLLSRSLRNERYNGGNPEYQKHLNALNTAGIIKENNPDKKLLKGDILVALMNSEGKNEYRRVENSYNFSMNDFNAVEDIYQNVRTSEGDRVIYIVRHSERINNCGSEGGLTDYGEELARGVGEKLKGAPFEDSSSDFYGSSIIKRAVQTSYYVGESRGSSVLEEVLDDDARNDYKYINHSSNINNVVYGNYFIDATYHSSIEHLYEENKEIVEEKAIHAINAICNITNGHPFSRFTSHDTYTLPITERATNENITFHLSTYDRPNFMQGVAIIVHKYGGWEIYPVRSLETGKMDGRTNPSCS